MSAATAPAVASRVRGVVRANATGSWWPLAALLVLAAALRFGTLDLQSFWYDEAFTPVHVLHPSLWATLRSVAHSENTPPLWYVLAWADARLFGTGEVALRWPSALAGTATVAVAWAIGRSLTGRRATAMAAAAVVAVDPLFVWYSQEARAYALFVFFAALSMLCLLRARARPSRGRLAAFALSGALALLSHYFAAFLLAPMCALLLLDAARERDRAGERWSRVIAVCAIAAVGAALVPLIIAQGGHGAQWIGRWPLDQRLEAIPQYYLTGYNGASLGHGIELLVALPILTGLGVGLWRVLTAREEAGAALALGIAAAGALIPLVLVAFGADYLAPRNLVAAMIPLTAMIAVVVASARAARAGSVLIALIAIALLAISVDTDLSPRLQRGNWRDLARALAVPARATRGAGGARSAARGGAAARVGAGALGRVISTVELGSAPLEYYLPGARGLPGDATVAVSEVDETGYAPLRRSAGRPPAPGFRLVDRLDVDGLVAYRFVSAVPRRISATTLLGEVITRAHPEVLVLAGHGKGLGVTRTPSVRKKI